VPFRGYFIVFHPPVSGFRFSDKDGIALPGVFTRRVAAKEVPDHDEASSHPRPSVVELLFLGSKSAILVAQP
jgi:hypothetical protein